MKICLNCEKEIAYNRKYCDDKCNYWYKQKQKGDCCGGWGSRNSQFRLNKKSLAHAKRIRAGKAPILG